MYGRLLFNSVEAIVRNVKYTNKQRLLLFNGNIDNNVMVKRCLAATSVLFSGDDKNIVRSPFPDVVVPNIPLPNFIWDDNAKIRSDHIALVCVSGNCLVVIFPNPKNIQIRVKRQIMFRNSI